MDMVTELKKALSEAAEVPVESLKDDVALAEQGISSFQVVTAYVWLERELDISFQGDQLPDASTATIEEVAKSIEAIRTSR
ncbi:MULTISPECIES: phosphopantetheine-binding protein [unclassified Streptomyces]|jgi:acyl carrier protein|uniref:phosphopantetheine-binding protein n=1 Tax=unclassified Streptomyces TaxID=2593676 RepID=UPI001CBE190F|nr:MULTISPECIES: phosphopantetheine-binding protein [unclassified Streptomyces]WPO71710.1 phosphopantetheine-binding protein [Streptomyces sp. KN37]